MHNLKQCGRVFSIDCLTVWIDTWRDATAIDICVTLAVDVKRLRMMRTRRVAFLQVSQQ